MNRLYKVSNKTPLYDLKDLMSYPFGHKDSGKSETKKHINRNFRRTSKQSLAKEF